MTSKMLQKARDFEKKYLPYTQSEQPRFHVTGGIGWINDPNGFAPYKGEYHLFFQYYPYDTKWGPMHWGDTSRPAILSTGSGCPRRSRPTANMTGTAASPAAQSNCRTAVIC